jgi:hypothetical protein
MVNLWRTAIARITRVRTVLLRALSTPLMNLTPFLWSAGTTIL